MRRLIIVGLVLVGLVAACGDSGTEEPVTFGEGEIPSTIPGDFPVPPQSRIGNTLIDRVNNNTEFAMTSPLSLQDIIDFYMFELVDAGYVVSSSADIGALWEIEFTRDDLVGQVRLQGMNPSVTQAVVRMNRS